MDLCASHEDRIPDLTSQQVSDVLCMAIYQGPISKTIKQINNDFSSVGGSISSGQPGYCFQVGVLPNPSKPSLYFYKFLFVVTLNLREEKFIWGNIWGNFSRAMTKATTIKEGRVICGSRFYFHTYLAAKHPPLLPPVLIPHF